MVLLTKTFLLGYHHKFISGFLLTFQTSFLPPSSGKSKQVSCWVNWMCYIGGVQI